MSTVFNLEFKRKPWNTINLIPKLFHWKFFHSFPLLSLSLLFLSFHFLLFSFHPLKNSFRIQLSLTSSSSVLASSSLSFFFLLPFSSFLLSLTQFLLPPSQFLLFLSRTLSFLTSSRRFLLPSSYQPTPDTRIPSLFSHSLSHRLFFLLSESFLSQMRHFLKEGK